MLLAQLIVILIVLCVVFGLMQQLLSANPFKTPALVLVALLGCLLMIWLAFGPPGHSAHPLFW